MNSVEIVILVFGAWVVFEFFHASLKGRWVK